MPQVEFRARSRQGQVSAASGNGMPRAAVPSRSRFESEDAMSATGTLFARQSLVALAEQIVREHKLCVASYRYGLRHAIVCGRLLIEAKAQVPHGEWLDWLRANFNASERAAQGYMRLAREPNPQRVADMSVRNALEELADPRKPGPPENSERVGVQDNDAPAQPQAVEPDRDDRFPRPGVERKTWRDIESDLAEAEDKRRMATKVPTLVPDAKADLLLEAKGACERAAQSLGELAEFVRSVR